jgi:hypothetical protein
MIINLITETLQPHNLEKVDFYPSCGHTENNSETSFVITIISRLHLQDGTFRLFVVLPKKYVALKNNS